MGVVRTAIRPIRTVSSSLALLQTVVAVITSFQQYVFMYVVMLNLRPICFRCIFIS